MPSLVERFEVDTALQLATGLQDSIDRSRAVRRESTQMSNTENPSLVAQEPSSFEVAVRDRSWDWLLELRRRLKVDLLLVDSRPSVLLPTSGDQAARLSAMLEHGETALLSAIGDVAEGTLVAGTRSRWTANHLCSSDHRAQRVWCAARWTSKSRSSGCRCVSRATGAGRVMADRCCRRASPQPASISIERLEPSCAACAVTRASVSRESDRELIRLFGEAIAVWHDIEVSGYVETTAGAFARDVTLPGTKKGERPAMIPSVGLPDSTDLIRLPQGHLDRFGLPVNDDVYVRRFKGTRRTMRGSWSSPARSVLTIFSESVRTSRCSISRCHCRRRVHRSNGDDDQRVACERGRTPETQATRALEELRTSLGAAAATLTIESKSGVVMLRVTCPAGASRT